ncbi:Helix-turn-helix domain protein [uncultured archaeon]|nr:Helix-turn-helix domain protein [uncultured archaeon]
MSTEINIDLNDPRSVEIAEILGNKTCKNILNLIANKEMTESDIAQELKIPLNTVDYNVKKLVKAGLIESSSHFWSVRGKKMPSYKVSEKKIVISPRSLMNKVFILPVVTSLALVVDGFRRFFLTNNVPQLATKAATVSSESSLAFVAAPVSDVVTSCGATTNVCGAVVQNSPSFFSNLAGWEWLLICLWVGALGYLAFNLISERRPK